MSITCSNCSITLPALAKSCGRDIEKGGVVAFGIVSCSNTTIYANQDDIATWQAAVALDQARVVKNVIAGLPYPSDVTKRLGACEPEYLTGRVFTLDGEDYDYTTVTSPSFSPEKLNFYNDVMADPSKYNLYYTECQGYTYYVPTFTLSVSSVTPNDNTQDKMFAFKFSFQQMDVPLAFSFNLLDV